MRTGDGGDAFFAGEVEDDALRLFFTCCHPAEHARAPWYAATDWPRIVRLYDALPARRLARVTATAAGSS